MLVLHVSQNFSLKFIFKNILFIMDVNQKRNVDLSCCLKSLESHKITERKVIFMVTFCSFVLVLVLILPVYFWIIRKEDYNKC